MNKFLVLLFLGYAIRKRGHKCAQTQTILSEKHKMLIRITKLGLNNIVVLIVIRWPSREHYSYPAWKYGRVDYCTEPSKMRKTSTFQLTVRPQIASGAQRNDHASHLGETPTITGVPCPNALKGALIDFQKMDDFLMPPIKWLKQLSRLLNNKISRCFEWSKLE